MPELARRKLTLEYDGTAFSGWQRQPGVERTVQGVLEAALDRLPWEHGSVVAAGRTDAGVHAAAMATHVDSAADLPDEKMRLAINAHLPSDVAVLAVESVAASFEAQYSCCYRRYLYRIRMVRGRPRGSALDRFRVLHVFRDLDVVAMQEATQLLVGRHDFSSLATQETRRRERTVYLCDLRREAHEIRLHFAADGFLRSMVRTAVGTLLWVGTGKLRPQEVADVLAARNRSRAGPNVAPHGLYFVEAGYQPWSHTSSERIVADLAL